MKRQDIESIVQRAASGRMSDEEAARAWVDLMRFADSVGIGVGIVGLPGESSVVNRTMASAEVLR